MNAKLGKIFFNYKYKFILDSLTYLGVMSFPLISGVLLSEVFSIYESNQVEYIGLMIAIFLVSLLLRVVMVYIFTRTNATTRYLTTGTIRANMLNQMLDKPGSASFKVSNGEIINIIDEDVQQIEGFYNLFFNQFFSAIIFGGFAIVILYTTDTFLFFTIFIPVILIFIVLSVLSKKVSLARKKHRDASRLFSSFTLNILKNSSLIKLENTRIFVLEKLRDISNKRFKFALRDRLIKELFEVVYENIVNLGVILILIISILEIRNNQFSLKTFMLYIYYLNFISGTISIFGSYMVERKRTVVSSENILSIGYMNSMNLLQRVDFNPIELKVGKVANDFSSVKYKNVCYSYNENDDSSNGINSINLQIRKGEKIVIVGEVGSGKSTLIKVMIGMLKSINGDILVDGKNISDSSLIDLGLALYSSQNPNFFNTTILNNIRLDSNFSEEDVFSALTQAGFGNEIMNHEINLTKLVGVNGSKLSGGQKQRLSLARMIVRQPKIYFLDNFTSSIDMNTSEFLSNQLINDPNKTVIMISNKLCDMKIADKVVLVHKGTIESIGTYQEVFQTSIHFRQLINEVK